MSCHLISIGEDVGPGKVPILGTSVALGVSEKSDTVEVPDTQSKPWDIWGAYRPQKCQEACLGYPQPPCKQVSMLENDETNFFGQKNIALHVCCNQLMLCPSFRSCSSVLRLEGYNSNKSIGSGLSFLSHPFSSPVFFLCVVSKSKTKIKPNNKQTNLKHTVLLPWSLIQASKIPSPHLPRRERPAPASSKATSHLC